MATVDTTALWKQHLAGDTEAIGALYRALHSRLMLFCLGKLRDRAKAEDAASDSLHKLLTNESPEEIRNVEQWLFTVAKNHCFSLISKEQRHREIESGIQPLMRQQARHGGEEALEAESIEAMRKQALTEKEDSVWALHEEGYNNAEISGKLAMSEKTVANHKTHARGKLRQLLQSISQ